MGVKYGDEPEVASSTLATLGDPNSQLGDALALSLISYHSHHCHRSHHPHHSAHANYIFIILTMGSSSLHMNLLSICDRNISWVKTLQNNVFFLFTFYFSVVTAQSVAFCGPIVDHEKVYCRWPICRRTLDNWSQFFNAFLFNIDIHSLSQNHKPISTFPGSRESATFHMGPNIWEEGVPNTSPSMVVHHSIMFSARLFLDQRMVITGCWSEKFSIQGSPRAQSQKYGDE